MHSHFLFDAHELCYANRRVAIFIHRDDATSTEGFLFQRHGSCYVTTRVAILHTGMSFIYITMVIIYTSWDMTLKNCVLFFNTWNCAPKYRTINWIWASQWVIYIYIINIAWKIGGVGYFRYGKWMVYFMFGWWLLLLPLTIYVNIRGIERDIYIYICKHTIRVGSWDFRYGKWMKMGGLWINKNNQAWEDHRIYD